MENKEQLVQSIKEWVKNDNEIRALQAEVNKRKKEKKKTRYDRYEALNANLPLTTLAPDIEYITCDVCFKDTQDIIHGVFFRCLDCREDLCSSCYRKGRHSNLHRIYFMGHVPGEEGVDRNGKRREEEEAVPFSASPPRRSMLMDNDDD